MQEQGLAKVNLFPAPPPKESKSVVRRAKEYQNIDATMPLEVEFIYLK